jgi:hypothetical protein
MHLETELQDFACVFINGFLGACVKLRIVTLTFVMSACQSAWGNSTPTRRIFMKIYTQVYS